MDLYFYMVFQTYELRMHHTASMIPTEILHSFTHYTSTTNQNYLQVPYHHCPYLVSTHTELLWEMHMSFSFQNDTQNTELFAL